MGFGAAGTVRNPFVAGSFYPASEGELRATVTGHLNNAAKASGAPVPKAIIAPHAGYVYSGAIAGTAYARLIPARNTIRRVVLAGPSHRVPFRGIAIPTVTGFATPLGVVPLDRDALGRIAQLPFVHARDDAHAAEHSLEVHLPFLQETLGEFQLVPLVVGDATPAEVAAVLEALWGGPESLTVISSDLSHYETYETARTMDAATSSAIVRLDGNAIAEKGACGRRPIRGLLELARRQGMRATAIDVRNSGDTGGPKDRVVGYGSYIVEENPRLPDSARAVLLAVVREVVTRSAPNPQNEPGVDLSRYAPELVAPRAAFVTFTRQGHLRGCIGSLEAHQPLVLDVARNAFKGAFRDPRFPPITAEEIPQLAASISVLSQPGELQLGSEAELLSIIRPGIDGLILADGGKRGTFLPSVWEQLPSPKDFLQRLKLKAGLAADHWSPTVRVWRYQTESFGMALGATIH